LTDHHRNWKIVGEGRRRKRGDVLCGLILRPSLALDYWFAVVVGTYRAINQQISTMIELKEAGPRFLASSNDIQCLPIEPTNDLRDRSQPGGRN